MSNQPACATADPELFFPIGYGSACAKQIADAKAACRRCPIQAACLARVLQERPEYGIWAGTTPDERRNLYAPRVTILDRPELDEQVAKMTRAHMNLEQIASALQVSVAVIRRCSRRNRARKPVSA